VGVGCDGRRGRGVLRRRGWWSEHGEPKTWREGSTQLCENKPKGGGIGRGTLTSRRKLHSSMPWLAANSPGRGNRGETRYLSLVKKRSTEIQQAVREFCNRNRTVSNTRNALGKSLPLGGGAISGKLSETPNAQRTYDPSLESEGCEAVPVSPVSFAEM